MMWSFNLEDGEGIGQMNLYVMKMCICILIG